ncbi:MAG: FkbM family methyltransferase [Candidatus Viridilinea halotolerans]|uniref:FkbM family methyltransferase n=1 Tax=Candidatus Viridilinea halotolerans TaxID=2491704 RepID=A0A426TRY8_9CHLR|nr:MAG: FkbM family methyltransferase [Candidatus Viridilinea halotolerans]
MKIDMIYQVKSKLSYFLYKYRRIPRRFISILRSKPILLKLSHFKIYVQLNDWAVGMWLAAKRTYEPHVTRAMTAYMRPGGVVVDIGANIGYYTLLAAALVGTTGKVIAFEPSTENQALLAQSINANNFHNVTVYPYAVSSQRGQVAFAMNDSNGAMCPNEPLSSARRVETVTLDSMLQDEPCINLIKMDIEGAEGLALAGMQEIVRRHQPVIFSEFSPLALRNISGIEPEAYLDQLRALGYILSVVSHDQMSVDKPCTNTEIMQKYIDSQSNHIDIKAEPLGTQV